MGVDTVDPPPHLNPPPPWGEEVIFFDSIGVLQPKSGNWDSLQLYIILSLKNVESA